MGLASGLLVLPATVRHVRSGPARLLSAPFVAWVGTVSYGMYLWHVSWLRLLNGPHLAVPGYAAGLGRTAVLFLATTAGAIALGASSWYLVERPAQRYLGRRRRPERAVPAAALGLPRS
jgi:peptidoglycan/LPS O-acetylase OafA/YrhL